MRPSSNQQAAASKSRPWPGHQRLNVGARVSSNFQPKQKHQKTTSLRQQVSEEVEEDMKRSLPGALGAKLTRVGGQTISTGSLAAALSQYQPPKLATEKSSTIQQQQGPSSFLEVSYQPQAGSNQDVSEVQAQSKTVQLSSNNSTSQAPLLIRRSPNLKFVKCLVLCLMGLDLLLTCLVYHLARDDQINVWRWRIRLSLLNLIVTALWFALLIGAILFHLYRILVASALLHLTSFGLLLVLSFVHFARRIDYNQVHLAKLLALLFAIILLHVYLLVMAALTFYLARGVRRRHRHDHNHNQTSPKLNLNPSSQHTMQKKTTANK